MALSCVALLQGCNASRALDDSNADSPALRMRGKDHAARSESHLLVLDEDAIAPGREPTRFSEADVRGGEPQIGNRRTLEYFENHVGEEVVLPAGSLGDEGWFAFTHVRHLWKAVGPDRHDGLRNYYEAGPGLGSPDAKGRSEELLDRVPGLMPLRATGLGRLEGRSVCAIVLDGDVAMKYNPMSGDLRGRNLGKVAFHVLSTARATDAAETDLPQATVRILDASAACNDDLKILREAPNIVSADLPRDTDRPECVVQRTVLDEEWNTFDEKLWVGDGDQVVADGMFFARPSAFAAAAYHIPAIPVPIETNGAIRFTNRLQLLSELEYPFAESGALFMVNADSDDQFKNYVFVNVGYTMSPSFVFVELFGSDNGVDFDQFEQTAITFRQSRLFSVDLWIQKNAYMVGIGGEMVDTVHLQNALTSTALFEVSVQQNEDRLRGLLHSTSITQLCPKENKAKCRKHWSYRGKKWKARIGKKCHTRNSYIRLARERIKHVKNPSKGLRCLAQMRELPET